MNSDISPTLEKVTRIVAGDDRTQYDRFSITLHWLTAVLAQFVLAETWGWFAKPTRHLMITTHMLFGILLTAVIVIRVIWRLVPGHQMPATASGWMELAKAVHYLLWRPRQYWALPCAGRATSRCVSLAS